MASWLRSTSWGICIFVFNFVNLHVKYLNNWQNWQKSDLPISFVTVGCWQNLLYYAFFLKAIIFEMPFFQIKISTNKVVAPWQFLILKKLISIGIFLLKTLFLWSEFSKILYRHYIHEDTSYLRLWGTMPSATRPFHAENFHPPHFSGPRKK